MEKYFGKKNIFELNEEILNSNIMSIKKNQKYPGVYNLFMNINETNMILSIYKPFYEYCLNSEEKIKTISVIFN
jgi:hypothetical protein